MNTPPPPGSTNVVALATSTANDKLIHFEVQIQNVSLTDAAGNSVTLLDRSIGNFVTDNTEFMHLNGASEPMAITSVPQGTYTSATVKIGACLFAMYSRDLTIGGPLIASFADEGCGQGKATVKLSSPITISGQAMALSFNLQVSQSYTLTSPSSFTISPVFTVTPMTVSAQPTNDQNGKVSGVNAVITGVNPSANSFMAQTTSGFVLNVSANGGVLYQRAAGLSSLGTGLLVNFDAVIQPDGTLSATRVELDNAAANAGFTELLLFPASPAGTTVAEPQDCFPAPGATFGCQNVFRLDPSVTFQISGQVNNLQNLPFTPNFSSPTLFLGQSVLTQAVGNNTPLNATSITLVPQTINGTVTSVSSAGSLNVYTVSLAPYALIPTTQQFFLGPFPAANDPSSVTVYADSNTQLLQSGSIGVGSLLRFRGVIFYDNGTFRMDCSKILDGVTE